MKLYFAHPLSDYNTQFEARVLGYLSAVEPFNKYEIVNPTQQYHQHAYIMLREYGHGGDEVAFRYWTRLAGSCDALVFLRMPSGRVGAGVAKEICEALTHGQRLFEVTLTATGTLQWQELPEQRLLVINGMSIKETKAELQTLYALPNGGRPW